MHIILSKLLLFMGAFLQTAVDYLSREKTSLNLFSFGPTVYFVDFTLLL